MAITWYKSFVNPTWSNDGQSYYDYHLDEQGSLIDPKWELIDDTAPDWSMGEETTFMYCNDVEVPKRLKYVNGRLIYYFNFSGINFLYQEDKYQASYVIDWYETCFYWWKKELLNYKNADGTNLDVFFKWKMMNRMLYRGDGVMYINYIEQFWMSNALPIDIKLLNVEKVDIPPTIFNTFQHNKTPEVWEFDEIVLNSNFQKNYELIGNVNFNVGGNGTVAMTKKNNELFSYDEQTKNIIIDNISVDHKNVALSGVIPQPPSPDDLNLFFITSPGKYKALAYIPTKDIIDYTTTPPDDWHYMFSTSTWQDMTFNLQVFEENTPLDATKSVAKIIKIDDSSKAYENGYYICVRNDDTKDWGTYRWYFAFQYWEYMHNVKLQSTGNSEIPIIINPKFLKHVLIKRQDFEKSKFDNKYRYLLINNTALGSSFDSYTNKDAINKLGSNFIVPIMDDFTLNIFDGLTSTSYDIKSQDYYNNLLLANSSSQIIINSDAVFSAFETNLPPEIFYNYKKIYFQQNTNDDSTIFPVFYSPSVDFSKLSIITTLYEEPVPISFDFSTWDETNEPRLFSKQFRKMSFSQSAGNQFDVPTDLFLYLENMQKINWNFYISIDTQPNLILDTFWFVDEFPRTMANDNFVYTMSQSWTFQTPAWNTWIKTNMTTEYTARKNYADHLSIQNANFTNGAWNSVIGGILGSAENMGGAAVNLGFAEQNTGADAAKIIKGGKTGFYGAIANGVAGFGLGIYNLVTEYQNMKKQQAMGQRSLNSAFANIRMSPNSLSVSPNQATNVVAYDNFFVNILTPNANQTKQILKFVQYYGECVNANFDIQEYDNRIYYNTMAINTLYNYDKLNTIIKNSQYCKFINNQNMRDAFFAWLEQNHGFYKTATMEIDYSTNIEKDYFNIKLNGLTTDWYFDELVSAQRIYTLTIYGVSPELKIDWEIRGVILNPDGTYQVPEGINVEYSLDKKIATINWLPTIEYPSTGTVLLISATLTDLFGRKHNKQIVYKLFTVYGALAANQSSFDSNNYLVAGGFKKDEAQEEQPEGYHAQT